MNKKQLTKSSFNSQSIDDATQLIAEWLADESGYDEKNWSIVKKAIEENRLSYRRRFGEFPK